MKKKIIFLSSFILLGSGIQGTLVATAVVLGVLLENIGSKTLSLRKKVGVKFNDQFL